MYLPLRMVGMQFHAAEDGLAAADKAFAVIDEAPARREAGTGSEVPADNSVELVGVSVHSRSGLAPHRLDVSCRPGQVTVLTGANGSGKSTALQAILGLAEPAEGAVRVGGVDVAYWTGPGGGTGSHGSHSIRCWCRALSARTSRWSDRWIPGPTRFTAPVEQPDSTRFSPSSHAGGTPSSGSVAPASRSASGSASR